MRFLRPEFALWGAAVLVVLALVRWRGQRRFIASTTVRWLSRPAFRASVIRRLPAVVLIAALVLTIAALMEPVLPYSVSAITSRGLDIVVVLDLSSSMQEQMEPIRPGAGPPPSAGPAGETRLAATKLAITNFVSRRRDDRVGLVVFSDNAYVISPLTFDRDYVVRYIDMVDDQILRGEGMTSIGDGLALANTLLTRQARTDEHRNQVVVLFTDGENNHGREPLEVLGESSAANIRVHMVGVDLESMVWNKPQVQQLFQAVQKYGGKYYNANSSRDLDAASRAIDQVEKGALVSRAYVRDAPVYQWFALPALLCFTAAIGLRAIPYFVDYT
jgi:Ca-activated chloride channel homolog